MGKIYEALERAHRESDFTPSPAAQEDQISMPADIPSELAVLERPGSSLAEQFRFLRSLVIRPMSGKAPRTILIASVEPQEGKTFVSANLAATIAQGLDEYVLLVDADLRKPNIHTFFGITGIKRGLAAFLKGDVPLADVLVKTSVNKLTLLPGDIEGYNPAELLSSEKMKAMISELRDRYADRLVIFDSAPLSIAPETFVTAREVEGIILVVRRGQTPRDEILQALEKIPQEKLLGVVFNGYSRMVKKQGIYVKNYSRYGYGYGYGRAYKEQKK